MHGQALDTGDLAYTDDEGRIYIAGRAKDVIIRSGHNIDPAMIEEVLGSHPAVSLAAAVGQPDRYAGEVVACYVKLKDGFSVTAEELRQFAEPLIAERPAWPKRYYIVESMPVTTVGKIFKPDLRADAARRLITHLLAENAGLNPRVEVSIGGARGMHVRLTLPASDPEAKRKIEEALQGYNFEFTVTGSD
jgi:fatty-acyl-CoA synthase